MAEKIMVLFQQEEFDYLHGLVAYDIFNWGRHREIPQRVLKKFVEWPPIHQTIGWPRQPRDWWP